MARSRVAEFFCLFSSGISLANAQSKSGSATQSNFNNHQLASSTATTPRNTTFSTLPTEISQLIFSHLDFVALLRCRCVCRTWKDRIPGDSPDLRRAMFLPPTEGARLDRYRLATIYVEIHTHCQPFPRTPDVKAFYVRKVHKIAASYTPPTDSAAILHPFIERLDTYAVARVPNIEETKPGASRDYLVSLKNKAGDLVQPDEHDLWRAMHAISPPVVDLKIMFRYFDRAFEIFDPCDGRNKCALSDEDGVRFADVLLVIERHIIGLLHRETTSNFDPNADARL